jgi:hypothetical protein
MTPRLITLSSEQRSAAGRDDDACPMHCEALHRGILTPRAMCRRAHDWRGLDRDEPSTDVSIVVPRARASRLRYRPSACRARAAKLVTGFTLETETAATCALLRVHALTIRNAFRLASSYALARRWFPSHRRRTHVPLRTDRGPLPETRELSRADRASYAVLGTAVCAPCTDSLALAARPPSGVFP